ncbi:flagellar M-ring protein FliF [Permianibacter sp. IMCC34836]|uniref:flagellar basal-body MS-ring/collar protein FliF n=1 Tax=Permianibacter fluminis TaxID=2738515 RepID=UPI00155384E1|nr:flagellar basal-body MS-ring/collar protein FliF [Permianibacter fluminis]NQD38039.1 flagellar M-ring protein FliF [Permianibacter fluminis]
MAEAAQDTALIAAPAGGFASSGVLANLSNMTMLRQIGILIGLAGSVALGLLVVLWLRDPLMRPLGPVDRENALAIVSMLEQQKVPYRLESDGSISVAQDDYSRVQMQLAAQGMELGGAEADKMLARDSGFSVSQRLEQARLLRTQEIRIARTIEQFAGVRAAEVHLALPKEAVFLRDNEKPTASVLLNLYSARSLDAEQIRAIVDLVAGSVPNLDANRVTITDQFGRLHHSGSMTEDEIQASKEFAESQKRGEELRRKVERILEPILGAGNYTVELHVDMDFSAQEATQKVYNADLPALRSERTLNEQNATGGAQGVPGALSNQPPTPATAPEVAGANSTAATAANGSTGSKREEAERNYDHDTTISHTRSQIGVVRRVTASVGLDFVELPATDPAQPPQRQPRPAAEVANITRLVQSAIGYDAQRGDIVELQSFPFVRVAVPEVPQSIPFWEQPWFQLMFKPLLGLIIAVVFVLGVLRPVLGKLSGRSDEEVRQATLAAAGLGPDGMRDDTLSLSGGSGGALSLPPPVTTELDSVARAKAVVQSDPTIVAQVVKTWMEKDA